MKKKALFLVNLSTVYMCYSKLTLKGTSPVTNEPYKFFYLKITGETKMTCAKHEYEFWTNIDYFSVRVLFC